MKVLNKRVVCLPRDAVLVDRATRWGNPFSHLDTKTKALVKVETLAESVELYEKVIVLGDFKALVGRDLPAEVIAELMAQHRWVKEHLPDLAGKDLVCWCAPNLCHGDVLLRHANQSPPQSQSQSKEEHHVSDEIFRVCFTGHREKDLTSAMLDQVRSGLFAKLVELQSQHSDLRAISGMASGVDQIAAEICNDLDIAWTAAVPHVNYAEHYGLAGKQWDQLLATAAKVVYVCPDDVFHWRMNFLRNEWMIKYSNLVIACYKGDPDQITATQRPRGGTAHAISTTKRMDTDLYVIQLTQ